MKNYDEMIAKLQAAKKATEEMRKNDVDRVAKALMTLDDLTPDSRKELEPAIKRLEMFVKGERYTRTKKD